MARKKEKVNSTIKEELLKVTDVKSKEQIKKPKRILFSICLCVAFLLTIIIFVVLKFTGNDKSDIKLLEDTTSEEYYIEEDTKKSEIIKLLESESESIVKKSSEKESAKKSTSIKETDTTKKAENKKETETTKKAENKKETETTKKAENKKETETTKKIESKTESTKGTTKSTTANRELETTKAKETISSTILNKAQNKKTNTNITNENIPILNKILPKYDTEIYSIATFYQYSLDDVKSAFTQLTAYYKKIEDKVFGEIGLDEKGTNGRIYINYTNMKKYIDEITDIDEAKYASLVDVQTTDNPVTFDFTAARDMGMYYEIPAKDGDNKINLMILKGAKVGFSQSYALTATLEIIDIEWNTKHNPYFAIDELVGVDPIAKQKFTDFNIDETLKTTKFNRIKYDKKGYITDIFYFK